MKIFKPLRVLSAALAITACGGSSSSSNLFDEVEQIQNNAESLASLSRTENSILGFFEDEEGALIKIERNNVTTASRDFCDSDGKKVEKQISFSIEPITNEEQGIIIIAQDVKVDYSDCPGDLKELKETFAASPEFFEQIGLRLEGNSLVVPKGFEFMEYSVQNGTIYDEYGDAFGTKLFDLQ